MWPDPPEIESLQPREDRSGALRDLLRLGGGEYEHHPRRRLFEDLEQRVPRFPREHVRFVDDVDLVATLGAGGVHGALAQVPRVVDAPVGGRVQLDHVEVGLAGPDPGARFALAARLAVLPVAAIQRHGQDPGGRGLAHTARAGEEIAVRRPAARHGPAQGGGHVILDEEIGELLGTILAGEGDHHKAECGMRIVE